MTQKERLAVHAEIVRQNAQNVKRWKVKRLYSAFVRGGQFSEGRMVLRLLRDGLITMRLDDVSWNVQTALEHIGHPVWYSRNGCKAEARLERGRRA